MKCAISLLLERYQLELVDAYPRRNYEMGVVRPAPPCVVRYRRKPDHAVRKQPALSPFAEGPTAISSR